MICCPECGGEQKGFFFEHGEGCSRKPLPFDLTLYADGGSYRVVDPLTELREEIAEMNRKLDEVRAKLGLDE